MGPTDVGRVMMIIMRLAKQHAQAMRDYIVKECEAGGLLGLFDPQVFLEVPVNGFGVIPKTDPSNWRLILDLSSLQGASVNDGINPRVCSLSYMTVDDAARAKEAAGVEAMLAKVDIKSAYHMISTHTELLGIVWVGALYMDSALPFGLRSVPKIFTSIVCRCTGMVPKARRIAAGVSLFG